MYPSQESTEHEIMESTESTAENTESTETVESSIGRRFLSWNWISDLNIRAVRSTKVDDKGNE
jgi:uncharacterized membrane protein